MYITGGRAYYRGTEQHASRGRFLILLSDDYHHRALFAIVRTVALSQCGQFMMGTARVYGHSLVISGAYGSDGLPLNVDRLPEPIRDRVRAEMKPLPRHLYQLWADGGGWNGAGTEADGMRRWALSTFEERK